MTRAKKSPVPVLPPIPTPVPVAVEPPGSPIDAQERRRLYEDTLKAFQDLVQEYNAQELGVPDRLRTKAQAILGSQTLQGAHKAAERARQSALIFYLSAWAQKKIPGKITELNVEQKARRAEGLADYLDRQGQAEAAERQRQRAQGIRALVSKV